MAPNLVRSLNSRLTYAYLVVGSKTMNELSTYNLGKLDKKKAVKSLLNMIALGLGWQNQMVPIKEMPWRSQYNNFLIMYRRVFITSWLFRSLLLRNLMYWIRLAIWFHYYTEFDASYVLSVLSVIIGDFKLLESQVNSRYICIGCIRVWEIAMVCKEVRNSEKIPKKEWRKIEKL